MQYRAVLMKYKAYAENVISDLFRDASDYKLAAK
jgi:hypothetical protein